MFLMNLRPLVTRPIVDRAVWLGSAPPRGLVTLGFELEERFPMANELWVRRADRGEGIRRRVTPLTSPLCATIHH
jgi:hypothetical protein